MMKCFLVCLLLCVPAWSGFMEAVAIDRGTDQPSLAVGKHLFHRRLLANGLHAVSVKDEGEDVTVFMVIGAGKRQETADTTGLAHLTEHAMYTGTAKTGPGEHDRFIQGLGGQSNAFTREDYTLFYDHKIPVQFLDEVLAMEADRLRNITFDEKAVLHEQNRLKIEEENTWQPSTARIELLEAAVYRRHPYGAGLLDEKGHTRAPVLNIPSIRRFYDLYYQPDNTAVVVAGAVDPAFALDAVERAFGSLPKGPERPPLPEEPDLTEPRAVDIPSDLPRDRLEYVWIVPAIGDRDRPALDVLARMITRLTMKDGSVLSASMGSRVDKELFRVWTTNPESFMELETHLDRLRTSAMKPAEVEEVKSLLRDDFSSQPLRVRPYFSLAGLFGVYEVLSHAEVMAGYEAAIDGLTPQGLQKVAFRHLDPVKRIKVRFVGTGEKISPLPDDPKALHAAAEEAVETGDLDRAIEAYTKLLDRSRSKMYQVIYLSSRGQVRIQQKDYDGAIADFESALKIIEYPAVRDLLDEARALKAGAGPDRPVDAAPKGGAKNSKKDSERG